jgi:hypothetical protein
MEKLLFLQMHEKNPLCETRLWPYNADSYWYQVTLISMGFFNLPFFFWLQTHIFVIFYWKIWLASPWLVSLKKFLNIISTRFFLTSNSYLCNLLLENLIGLSLTYLFKKIFEHYFNIRLFCFLNLNLLQYFILKIVINHLTLFIFYNVNNRSFFEKIFKHTLCLNRLLYFLRTIKKSLAPVISIIFLPFQTFIVSLFFKDQTLVVVRFLTKRVSFKNTSLSISLYSK